MNRIVYPGLLPFELNRLYRQNRMYRLFPMVILVVLLCLTGIACKHSTPTGPPAPVERQIQFKGKITGTFSRNPLAGVNVHVELQGQSAGDVQTDGSGNYAVTLKYLEEQGKLSPPVTYQITGSQIRFQRETSFFTSVMKDVMEFDINCIETYGDGANFSLNIYHKLNSDTNGNPFPTSRWYPGFPEVYIVRSAGVTDWQYQQVKAGVVKISQMSRGAIPPLTIHTVSEVPADRNGKITHQWVPDEQLPGACARIIGSGVDNNYSIFMAGLKYKKRQVYCSSSSFHEMMHAMMIWGGLDSMTNNEISDHQFTLQIYFAYNRYPHHTFNGAIDSDKKP
jgi:hypothetical protein